MRILEQTPQRLVLEIRPVALVILCLGLTLLFLALGFGMPTLLPLIAGLAGFPGAAGLGGAMPGMGLLGYAAVIPALVAVLLLKTRRLSFDRGTGRVTLAERGLLGRSEASHDLAGFRGASVQVNRRAGNNSTTTTALLHFAPPTGTVPVTPYGTGGSEPARTAEAINAWLGPVVHASGQTISLSPEQAGQILQDLLGRNGR